MLKKGQLGITVGNPLAGPYAAIGKSPRIACTAARYCSMSNWSRSIIACTGYPMIKLTAAAATPAGLPERSAVVASASSAIFRKAAR